MWWSPWPIELSCAGQTKPGLEVLGNGLAEQRALGLTRVVEFGLCTRLPVRKSMRACLGWACGDGHGFYERDITRKKFSRLGLAGAAKGAA